MLFTSLDQITRRNLIEKRLPLHFYMERLFHAATCVRQLSKDTLQLINTVKLPINSYSAVQLPDDFVDDVGVYFNIAGKLTQIPHKTVINPLRNKDANGNFVPYSTNFTDNALTMFGFIPGWSTWFWNVNDFGEPTGRYFGLGGGSRVGYQVFKERRQIQLTENVGEGEIVLMYISDGVRADNATQVDVLAWDAVDAFINWKASPMAEVVNSPQGQNYHNQRRLLRAALNPITAVDIKDIIHKNYHATIKT